MQPHVVADYTDTICWGWAAASACSDGVRLSPLHQTRICQRWARPGESPTVGPLIKSPQRSCKLMPQVRAWSGHGHGGLWGLLGERPDRAASSEKRVGEARGEPLWLLPIDWLLDSCPAQPTMHVNLSSLVLPEASSWPCRDAPCTTGASAVDKYASMTTSDPP